jgi:hypothetical protein
MNDSQVNHLIKVLHRIADSLDTIIDKKKRTLRMVDVDRGKVYKTHLGKNMRNPSTKKGGRS